MIIDEQQFLSDKNLDKNYYLLSNKNYSSLELESTEECFYFAGYLESLLKGEVELDFSRIDTRIKILEYVLELIEKKQLTSYNFLGLYSYDLKKIFFVNNFEEIKPLLEKILQGKEEGLEVDPVAFLHYDDNIDIFQALNPVFQKPDSPFKFINLEKTTTNKNIKLIEFFLKNFLFLLNNFSRKETISEIKKSIEEFKKIKIDAQRLKQTSEINDLNKIIKSYIDTDHLNYLKDFVKRKRDSIIRCAALGKKNSDNRYYLFESHEVDKINELKNIIQDAQKILLSFLKEKEIFDAPELFEFKINSNNLILFIWNNFKISRIENLLPSEALKYFKIETPFSTTENNSTLKEIIKTTKEYEKDFLNKINNFSKKRDDFNQKIIDLVLEFEQREKNIKLINTQNVFIIISNLFRLIYQKIYTIFNS